MCGIAGIWHTTSQAPADPGVIRAMTRSLAHRGPDDEGYFVEGPVALGQRRLVVVDPEGGRQPMPNEDGRVRAVFNGEIYNHGELRRELARRGHAFRTRSDTEAVVHAWEEWGERCVERFNGMFALGIWDARRRVLFLARDRLGIKPLYVHEGPHGVAFGSELKAVVTAPWVPLEWDLEAVDDFMTYEYVPGRRSIVRAVRKVAPGTSLALGEAGFRNERRYWTLEATADRPEDPRAAQEELRQRLRKSVERRLMADVPLGAFLSGGIDSSVIVALMAGRTSAPPRTFSMGFDNASYNELPYALAVAELHATEHHQERVTPEAVTLADRLADAFDEPFADVSAFPTYLISELARREVTVVLSGDGGDELFAGYDHYRAHRWAHRLRWLTRGWPWRAVEGLLDRIPPTERKKGPVNLAKRFAKGLRHPADLEHARWWVFQDLLDRRALYAGELATTALDRDPFGHYRARMAEAEAAGFGGLQRQLYSDITGYLADDILVKVDRMSMATSLEARVPFLDHEVVEHAMAVPGEWKLRGSRGKEVLKEAFRQDLPPEVVNRGKEGFSIPMKNWLRGPLRPLAAGLLGEEGIGRHGWFRPEEIERLAEEHHVGRENHAHRLWCLMSLELSLRSLERRARRAPSWDGAAARRAWAGP